MPEQEMNQVPPYEFYTQKRWENWLERAKESGFQLKESEEEAVQPTAAVRGIMPWRNEFHRSVPQLHIP
ncbi:MAG: DUF2150 family protein [Methanosarcina thermophila]